MTADTKENRPLLRVLKLAAKLHKAGLDVAETVQFIGNCRNEIDAGTKEFPSAALHPDAILCSSFVWKESVEGVAYWAAIHERLGGRFV